MYVDRQQFWLLLALFSLSLCASDLSANLALLSKADGEKSCPDSRLKPDFA